MYRGDDALEELPESSVVHVLRFDGGLVGVVFERARRPRVMGFPGSPCQET